MKQLIFIISIIAISACQSQKVEQASEKPQEITKASVVVEPSKPEPQPKEKPAEDRQSKEAESVAMTPDQLDLQKPISASDLYLHYFANPEAWLGKEVTVIGYYKGSTHSSATDRTRVDLKTGPIGKTAVGCLIAGKDVTPKSAAKDRAGVMLSGTIIEPFFGQVILENAKFLNRN